MFGGFHLLQLHKLETKLVFFNEMENVVLRVRSNWTGQGRGFTMSGFISLQPDLVYHLPHLEVQCHHHYLPTELLQTLQMQLQGSQ